MKFPGVEAGKFSLFVAQKPGEGRIAFQDAPIEMAERDAYSSRFEERWEPDVAIGIGRGRSDSRESSCNFHKNSTLMRQPAPVAFPCGPEKTARRSLGVCGFKLGGLFRK